MITLRWAAQKRVQAETSQADTLNNLTVYLTLQKAEQKGFKAEKYGLSGDQAAEYAVVFARNMTPTMTWCWRLPRLAASCEPTLSFNMHC